MLQAVLFDMDGTLLNVDMDEFVPVYLRELSEAMSEVFDPEFFYEILMKSTDVILKERRDERTNFEAFWEDFTPRLGDKKERLMAQYNRYYDGQYGSLVRMTKPEELACPAVQKALDHGLKIVLATNPVLFPETAIRQRMRWAGIDKIPWDLITTSETMHNCKPSQRYYREITSLINVKPENCLMVGNEEPNDIIPAQNINMFTFQITEATGARKSPGNNKKYGAGALSDFIPWLENLLAQ